ncbi:MAG: hypothetical protein DRI80_11575 [Chloroflexota bacterium]|nr:MAG: hypothetical protein DRI80_11575 [Chloroflexota bacterium]
MYQDTYYVPKRTGTYADVLTAYGLATILDRLFEQAKGPFDKPRIEILDQGHYYALHLSEPVREDWIRELSFFTVVDFVKRGDMETPAGFRWLRLWDEERERFFRYATASSEAREAFGDEAPRPDYRVLEFIGNRNMQATNKTRQGFQSYNRIALRWWDLRDHFATNLVCILKIFASPNVDWEEIAREWQRETGLGKKSTEVTCSQALNPMQGQGQNQPKASRLDTRTNIQGFWLLEYVKAAGLWAVAAPQPVRPPKKTLTARDWQRADWKVYVLSPLRLSFHTHREVVREFRQVLNPETSIKLDIIYVLLFVRSWLEYLEATHQDNLDFDIDPTLAVPENVVAGFHVAQFKLLSRNAYTMVNLSFLDLPRWTGQPETRADVLALKEVIDEHLDVIRGIDEGRSDGYNLLRAYRDFVAGNKWDAFYDFAVGYSHEIMRRLNEGDRWVPTFSPSRLRRLIMASNKPLLPIVQNTGFQNVAYAIRHSTVIPQGRKARGLDTLYDVRYGLGAELKRKATVRDEFVVALSNFMQTYNQENAQVLENTKQQMRRDLRTPDIEEVVRLVDEYGSEVVANLLVAFGYAREPREEAETPE